MTVVPSRDRTFSRFSAFLLSDGSAGFILSWVAGFVDTSAFIILFGIWRICQRVAEPLFAFAQQNRHAYRVANPGNGQKVFVSNIFILQGVI